MHANLFFQATPRTGNGYPQPSTVDCLGVAHTNPSCRADQANRTELDAPPPTEVPEATENALHGALRSIRSWPPPPNWSHADWREESLQVACWACFQAIHEYDPNRSSVNPGDFIRCRILARVLTAYRREWSFGSRCLPLLPNAPDEHANAEEASGRSRPASENTIEADPASPGSEVREALLFLDASGRWALVQIFWHGFTESELAAQLGLSQRAISKRKQRAIKQLRQRLLR